MNSKQIQTIESKLGIALPDQYKALLLGFPSILKSLLSYESETWARNVYDDPATIIDMNLRVRDNNPSWPSRYVAIGGDIGGNLYCIDVEAKQKNTKIYFWFHEERDSFSVVAKRIDLFIKHLFSSHADLALDELASNL